MSAPGNQYPQDPYGHEQPTGSNRRPVLIGLAAAVGLVVVAGAAGAVLLVRGPGADPEPAAQAAASPTPSATATTTAPPSATDLCATELAQVGWEQVKAVNTSGVEEDDALRQVRGEYGSKSQMVGSVSTIVAVLRSKGEDVTQRDTWDLAQQMCSVDDRAASRDDRDEIEVKDTPTPTPTTAPTTVAPAPVTGPTSGVGSTAWPGTRLSTKYKNEARGDVAQLQQRLNDTGWASITVDGRYGKQTASAVEYFQAANGLAIDGVTGPQTWAALFAD